MWLGWLWSWQPWVRWLADRGGNGTANEGVEAAVGELFVLVGGIAGSFLISRSTDAGTCTVSFQALVSVYAGLREIVVLARTEETERFESTLGRIDAIATITTVQPWMH